MRLEIVGGGEPSDEELAAVVVVLTSLAHGGSAAAGGTPTSRDPAWARASRFEGIGDRRAVSADDLAALERTVGRI